MRTKVLSKGQVKKIIDELSGYNEWYVNKVLDYVIKYGDDKNDVLVDLDKAFWIIESKGE